MTTGGGRRGLALLLAAAALAGCAGDAADTVATPAPSLSADASQTRPDAAVGGRFQVVVENKGPLPFTVRSVQLVSAGFSAEPPSERDTEFAPGHRVSLPAPFGAVRCGDPAVPAEVELALVVGGQQLVRRFPLGSDDGLLERIHARECASRALADQVALGLEPDLGAVDAGEEPGLSGTLTVTRKTAQGPIELASARGSVLYDVTLPDGPAVLAPEQRELRVPLLLTSRTCNGHVIGEAKKPYAFLAFLRVGAAEEASAPLPVSPDQQARILVFLDETCAQVTSTP